ncbi:MAG: general secretion pathway protein J [Motiliproteus sp.]|jgi:general secretion pathway protein J
MRLSTRQRGFTLIEMLVAVSLLALLGLASALALNSALRSQTIIGGQQDALEQLQRSQRFISRDLEQLVLRPGRDLLGNDLSVELIAFAQPDTSNNGLILQFFKTGHRILRHTATSSRLEQVRYRIEDLQLIRETTSLLDPFGSTPWRSGVLAENVSQMRLRFFHQQQWHNQWPPLNQANAPITSRDLIPAAIEIQWQTPRFATVTQLILLPGGH